MGASWACDTDNRRSVIGYVFCLGDAVISWSSKNQSSVAASSTEAEYMALSYAAKQALWLLRDIGLHDGDEPPTTELYADNTDVIAIAKGPKCRSGSHHISTHFPFAREKVEEETLSLFISQ